MRSIKSCGGLSRGRGFDDIQRTVWLLSTLICAEVSTQIRELAEVTDLSDAPHKQTTTAVKDHNDICKVVSYLHVRIPFGHEEPKLRSISTGRHADECVKCRQSQRNWR
ncbi:hypothetical protein PoB_004051700 [Plakobranchus ocellatus]|uniref:Uncharacterized protein n=1 Tax=Plakobranchus ocellatus TaxID=259542 RepID=A0AAV4B4G8_9GAST|nr:hypothetical protein PoB_004051700 [Plakobranchus ocellatus]